MNLVADFLRVQQMRAERELPTMESSHHLVFTGNPGTGKTTVARLLAQIYRTLGVVDRGHLVETDRSGLVAGFVGQTAPRVTERFDEADEGMLFIDEAYTLARGNENNFGREAIDQIVKLMEDRRDRVVLVVAGYPDEMDAFLATNPGLRSRFPTVIEFPDYGTEEILEIVDLMGARERYELTDEAHDEFARALDAIPRGTGCGNALAGRNLFEAAISRHASRVVRLKDPSTEQLEHAHRRGHRSRGGRSGPTVRTTRAEQLRRPTRCRGDETPVGRRGSDSDGRRAQSRCATPSTATTRAGAMAAAAPRSSG